jgi:hypothetical protein
MNDGERGLAKNCSRETLPGITFSPDSRDGKIGLGGRTYGIAKPFRLNERRNVTSRVA